MLAKIEFTAGVIKDETPLAAEGGWIDADKIRFRQGRPQVIGGWEAAAPTQFSGIVRGGHAWTDLLGQKQIAFGTAQKLYAYSGGRIIDITPNFSEGVLVAPFSTTSGTNVVTVKHVEHGLRQGQQITYANALAVGGLTINGAYAIASVVTRDSYTITHGAAATSTATGGGPVDYVAQWIDGLVDGTGGLGYGTGAYGVGVYGLSTQLDYLPAVWSLDSLGETLLANRRGGGLYVWQPQNTYNDVILNGGFDSDTQWAKGTGWAIASGVATKTAGTASNLSQNITGVAKPGYTYRVTATITRTAGKLKFGINAGDPAAVVAVGGASTEIEASGTYSRLFVMPATPIDAVFGADSTFAGAIDNVTLTLESKAFLIQEAPRRIESMFVDPNGVVVAVGTYEIDGDYNPNAVRNSDIGNVRTWVPDTDNLASEIILRGGGGRLVRGIATRQQNLVWGDDGLFRLQWQGEAGAAFTSDLLGTGCGLIGMNAAVEHNGIAFWLSNNGNFYIFQGAIPQVIECRVRQDVSDNITPAQEEKIYAGVNGEFSEVWWFYPDKRDGSECNRYVAFNWIENHWTTGTFGRSTWLRAGIYATPVAFGTDGYIYFHERGLTANGAAISPYLESSFFDIQDGDNLLAIKSIIPDFEAQSGAITFNLTTKSFPNAPALEGPDYVAMPNTQALRMRRLGRQASVKLASDGNPCFWRMGALRFDVEKTGARR